MKKVKVFLGLLVCAFMVVPFMGVKAETTVSDYDTFKAALDEGETYITLGANINVEAPIEVKRDVTIDGAGKYSLTAGYTKETFPGQSNLTVITSTTTGTLTLKNVTVENSPKYGVQAHNGGHVVLDGVTIKNSGFGAVNINGGTVTIKSLVMDNNSYGIEFGIGNNVTGVPTLIMDGSFETKNQTGVPIHVDTDQVTADKTIAVENTENTTQTIDLDGLNLVVKDASGVEVYRSDDLLENTTVEVSNPEVEEPTTPDTPKEDESEEVKDEVENPKTSDGIMIVFGSLVASVVVAIVAKKKLA